MMSSVLLVTFDIIIIIIIKTWAKAKTKLDELFSPHRKEKKRKRKERKNLAVGRIGCAGPVL
jgi:hypothetical protein